MPKVRIKIYGKVQGVFFRQSARQQAKALKVYGWIKNLPDGSVLCEAVGLEEALSNFINWCKKGPPYAKVSEAIVESLEEECDMLEEFQIIR